MSNLKSVTGECCEDAKQILDLSQGAPSLASQFPGHPRYHVLCTKFNGVTFLNELPSLGCTEEVTKYLGNWKTAFQSKLEQEKVLHEILSGRAGSEALNLLSTNAEVLLRVSTDSLVENRHLMMTKVSQGNRLETEEAKSTVLILGHHENQPEGMYVHVKTFYPTDRYVNGHQVEILK